MMKLKTLFASLILAAIPLACASAQGVGQLGAGQVWGNPTASAGRGQATNLSPLWDQAFGANNGTVLNRSGTWAETATPVLGVAGTTVGSIGFANATSGTETIQPATGALGTGVATLPAGSYNVVGDSLTQTLTSKTLTSPTINGAALSGTFSGGATFSGSNTFTAAQTVTLNNLISLTEQDASSTQDKLVSGVTSSAICDPGYVGTATAGACSKVNFTPNAAGAWNGLTLQATNSKAILASVGGAINPEVMVVDTAQGFGVPIWTSSNQSGIGLIGTARAGSGAPFVINLENLGATGTAPSSAEGSTQVQIVGGATNSAVQNMLMFLNGEGCQVWSATCSGGSGGGRLGEMAGSPTVADGSFSQTESISLNYYLEANCTGTHLDGSYTCPSNFVFRAAPNAAAAERIVALVDYNANLLLGANGSSAAWAASGNLISSSTNNSIVFYPASGNPTNNPPSGGGLLYTSGGALKYKSGAGTVTTIVAGP